MTLDLTCGQHFLGSNNSYTRLNSDEATLFISWGVFENAKMVSAMTEYTVKC